ncbi:MAG: ABC transporter permease [Lachnospiraceae bacterium]|nr:ABC transporter permease [Lachnospiraceae bacterium]
MIIRMIRGALIRQKGKMMLIAFTIALGTSLATAMLNVMLDVGDKVNQELKTYGANITVKPKDSSLLSDLYDVEDEGDAIQTSYLQEDEVSKLKTIFWAFNIVDFAPFMETATALPDGSEAKVVGTWFNHHLDLSTGESLDAGVTTLRTWWDLTEGTWIDEQQDSLNSAMVGAVLAEAQGWQTGDTVTLDGPASSAEVTIVGIFDGGGDEDEQIYAPLDLVQSLNDTEGKVSYIEVSALTTPDNDLARRAAQNPQALSSADYETWYCTAYVSAICYQIQEAITDCVASAVRQVAESEGTILDKTQLLMILITILSLIGAALGISNLVTASVMERAKEIGLLKAVGARDHSITGLVLTEILITALIGGVAGYFMGFGFAQLIGQTVFGSAIEMRLMVVPIVIVLIALVTAAGSVPAIFMVLRLDPAEVLHGSKA